MSDVFQNVDPHPPSWGGTHSLGGEGGGGSIFWKTQGTALYSTYVSTLWCTVYRERLFFCHVFSSLQRLNIDTDDVSL